ncbi:MAG: ABC transporter substrate-binding protein [Erysipelotrichaceae bacterium]|nr:ABC transporter substrate-binding protein [Erysipelotrichaceae bacterium]
MKKLLTILLALMMVLALGACSSSTADSGEPAATDEPVVYNVGILQLVQHSALDEATRGFREALTEKLGDQVVFDEQNAQGDSATCSTIATTFVANGYDLIMANATPAVQACINATTTIPVLGTSVTDYATALGVDSLNSDGSTGVNLSGTSDGVDPTLYAKAVMEIVPDAKKVAIVYCSAEPNSVLQADGFIFAMAELAPDVECTVTTFDDSNDIQAKVTAAIQDCDAMYIPTDNTAASNMPIVAGVTEPAGIPVICGEENMTKAGGLATVSISYYEIGYKCGLQAYEILVNGKDVAAMPIEYASDPVGAYNVAYAEAIGITMPDGYSPLAAE